jgi:outer membrane protein assembly factor BamB
VGRVRVFLVLGVLLVLGLVAAVPWALHERAERELDRPILIFDHFVSPRTGEVVGHVTSTKIVSPRYDGTFPFAHPDPRTPGFFDLYDLRVDAAHRDSRRSSDIELSCPWHDDHWRKWVKRVARRGPGGTPLWSVDIAGRNENRYPKHVVAGGCVVIGGSQALVALDLATGRVVWEVPGESEHLATDGHLVLGTVDGFELFARDAGESAAVVWSATLPLSCNGIFQVGRWWLASGGHGDWKFGGISCLFDRSGHLDATLPDATCGAWAAGDGALLLGKELVRIDRDARVVWRRPRRARSGSVTVVPIGGSGDLVVVDAEEGGEISVARLAVEDGREIWCARCAPFAEDPSGVQEVFSAYGEVRGDHLVVVQQDVYPERGYVEVLSLSTGKQRKRWVLDARTLEKR